MSNSKLLILSLKIYIIWLLSLGLFVLLGGIIFSDLGSLSLNSLALWDGRHYLNLAEHGYKYNDEYAFFPLYPVLISVIVKISGLSYLLSALLINLISTLGIIFIFLKLLYQYKIKNTLKVIFCFLIFPTSFFLIALYSESLFLLFTLSSFYFFNEKKILPAALFAAAASATRITGLALITTIGIEIYLQNKNKRDILIWSISFSGILSYCLFLLFKTGNPLYFLISELNWDRSLTLPGKNIFQTIQYIFYKGIKTESFTILSDLIFTIFGLGLVLRSIRFLKRPLVLYSLAALAIPLSTSLLLSIPRFLIIVFPIFILIAGIKNKAFLLSYIIVCLTLLFLYFNFFLRLIWVS